MVEHSTDTRMTKVRFLLRLPAGDATGRHLRLKIEVLRVRSSPCGPRPRSSMDRTRGFYPHDVGSIPTGGTGTCSSKDRTRSFGLRNGGSSPSRCTKSY